MSRYKKNGQPFFQVQDNPLNRRLALLFSIYIFSLPFVDLLHLPLAGGKVQLPELVFLVIVIVFLFHSRYWSQWHVSYSWLEFSLDGLATVFLLSAWRAGGEGPWLEFGGYIYLVAVYGLLRFWMANAPGYYRMKLVRYFVLSGLLAAEIGLLGWGLARIFGADNLLAYTTTGFPYLGDVLRAKGTMVSPTMLAIFLELVLLIWLPFLLRKEYWWKYAWPLFGLAVLTLLLTFSKSILVFLAGVLFVCRQQNPAWRKGAVSVLAWVGTAVLILGFVGGSHLLVYKKPVNWEQVRQERFSSGRVLWEDEKLAATPSNYWMLKWSALEAGRRHFWLGIGSGRHNAFVDQLKAEGRFPAHMPSYDPHSTYFGAFAELGVLGLGFLLLLFSVTGRVWRRAYRIAPSSLLVGLGACLFVLAVEAFSTDLLFFRPAWVLLGILGGIRFSGDLTHRKT